MFGKIVKSVLILALVIFLSHLDSARADQLIRIEEDIFNNVLKIYREESVKNIIGGKFPEFISEEMQEMIKNDTFFKFSEECKDIEDIAKIMLPYKLAENKKAYFLIIQPNLYYHDGLRYHKISSKTGITYYNPQSLSLNHDGNCGIFNMKEYIKGQAISHWYICEAYEDDGYKDELLTEYIYKKYMLTVNDEKIGFDLNEYQILDALISPEGEIYLKIKNHLGKICFLKEIIN